MIPPQGAVMADIAGLALADEDKRLLQDPRLCGLILFSRNYQNKEQLQRLVEAMRQERPELIIAVDQEGGRVQRFRNDFIRLPAMAQLGKWYDQSPVQAVEAAQKIGWLMAAELRELDIDLSFAPVLDLDWGVCSAIGDRSFHRTPEGATALASAFVKGMEEAGMAATGKHFPGHGAVQEDSHLDLPKDVRSFETIQQADLVPFASLIRDGLAAIMPAHVLYTQIHAFPAGFSDYWLQTVLRQQLGFSGIIFSDDLTMEGAAFAGGYGDRGRAALAAGCDILLVCNRRDAALELLQQLPADVRLPEDRLQPLRGKPGLGVGQWRQHQHYQEALIAAEYIARELC